ncbi:metallophosphoesterase [Lacticaseibacillus camelliae]|uniref:3, 5-cyclic-nucleotide phosphodiesterase n=1 Tax=Lacticaseibacillus camelliae DSM 22697 = JCM 13995 TaxID=1423730 RepID=A0A0R2EWL8_9LACO|nr:metallophosphoesterase [Lacticaseibacillus camelliae]KRN20761.1 3, 5-cyclic-nucleotide phosphodiesterase [Lacticaseibacillus camelliae DSM 22697 = JCM 13995]
MKWFGKILSALLAMSLLAWGLTLATPQRTAAKVLTQSRTPSFWVLSDSHFIAPALHDHQAAYREIARSAAGKDVDYQPVAIRALVHEALTARPRPTAVIITGDVTFNGAKASAQSLAKRLAPLQKAGIHVLVTPGNHDIYDGWARKYQGNRQLRVAHISPTDWRNIFSDGYRNETSEDADSLSYTVTLNRDYQLIMLDSNIYTVQPSNRNPNTGGELKPATMSWLRSQLAAAKKAGRTSLVFMHHNLYTHNAMVNRGYVLNNAPQLRKLLTQYHVPVVFSGHIHAQDIKSGSTAAEPVEIVDGAFSISPAGYGVVQLTPNQLTYDRQAVNVRPVLTAKQKHNPDLMHYQAYLKKLFLQNGEALAVNSLFDHQMSERKREAGVKFLGELNWRFFTGQDDISNAAAAKLRATTGYQVDDQVPSIHRYMKSIMQDKDRNDLHQVIPTK